MRPLAGVALAVALVATLSAQQPARVRPIVAPRAVPLEDALLVTHFNGMASGSGPCVTPSRILRITDLADASGWQAGPTAPGLTFHNANGLALDASRLLYVADRDNRRIIRMQDIFGTGWQAFAGSGSHQLSPPARQDSCVDSNHGVHDVAIDRAGRIYAAVSNEWRIVRVDNMSGAGWTTFQLPGNPFSGRGVFLDAQERIYIPDNKGHRVIRIDDMQGRGLVTLGTFGNGVRQFNQPMGIAFDQRGRIYIVDEYNHRIVRVDDMSGAGWITFGSYGSGVGQFSIPHAIKIDSLGRLHIGDTGNDRIVRMDDMDGTGWVTFGNRELQGRDIQFRSTKSHLVLGRGPAIPYLSILPVLAAGGGQQATFIAVNNSQAESRATVALLRGHNSLQVCPSRCDVSMPVTIDGVTDSTIERAVPPLGTLRLSVTASGDAVTGYARLRSPDDLGAFALVQSTRGDTIVSEAAVPPFDPADHVTIYVDNTKGARTALVLANPRFEGNEPPAPPPCGGACEGGWLNLTGTLRDARGVIVQTTGRGPGQAIALPPGYQMVRFVAQLFPAAGPGFEGTLELSSGTALTKVVAAALRYDTPASDVFTVLPAVRHVEVPSRQPSLNRFSYSPPSMTTTRYYPHVADGGSYRTEFVLLNPTDVAATATVQFFGPDGSPLALPVRGSSATSIAVPLPARGVERVVTAGTAGDTRWGWARLTSPAAIDAIVVLQKVAEGAIRSEAPVWAASPGIRLRAYVANSGSTESGIAVSNPNTRSVAATFLLRDANGGVVASVAHTLPARGYFAQLVKQLFPGVTAFEGTIDVETNGGPVAGVGIRYDNPDASVFTLLPIVSVPEPR